MKRKHVHAHTAKCLRTAVISAIWLFLLLCSSLSAQNIQVNHYTAGQNSITTYNGTITLGNGFKTNGNNVHIYITPDNVSGTTANPPIPSAATALSNSLNYIAVWTATAPDTDSAHLRNRPLKDVKLAVQYLDGLGRPIQTIAKQGSVETVTGTSKDIVLPTAYDNLGRESIQYLTYASSGNDGSFKPSAITEQVAFYSNTSTLAGQGENASNARGQVVYDGSPLNRTTEAFAPGNSWAGTFNNPTAADRVSTKMGYYSNTSADAVRIWDITYPTALGQWGSFSSSRTYDDNTLYKNIITDENGKQVIQFTDKQGKLILKKVQLTAAADNGSGSGYADWLCTYYVYDNFGQLKAIILPAAVKSMSTANAWTPTNDILNEQCFRYEYDAHGRVIMKKSPGAGEVHMLYDAKSRLVAMQDANMRDSNSRWLVTLYDDLDRPVETGLYNDGNSFNSLLTQVASQTSFVPVIDELSETHYDNYDGLSATGLSAGLIADWNDQFSATDNNSFPYPQAPEKSPDAYIQGAVTWTKTRVLYTNTYTIAVNIYDDQGRIIQTQSQNITGGVDVATTQYSWAGQPLIAVQKTQNTRTAASGAGEVIVAVSRITYDDLGRVVKTEKKQSSTSINGGTMTEYATIANMQYDELGQLKNKTLGTRKDGQNQNAGVPLETQAFDYNIRGWLLGVNRAYVRDLGSTNTTTDDGTGESFTEEGITTYSAGSNFFGFDLGYDKTDNQLINGQTYAAKQLNGSIAGMVWKNNADGAVRKYDFTYDAVNNLTGADFNQYTGSSFNKSADYNFSVSNLTYDANGNLLTMNQTGKKADGTTGTIDQLSYSYPSFSGFSGNKLSKVTDGISQDGGGSGDFQDGTNGDDDYSYDDNGNLITDKNKNIQNVNYNFLNLPQKITTANATIDYLYDAGGAELQKKVTTATTVTTTTYIGAAVYQQSSLNGASVVDTLQFFGMEEGRVRPAYNVQLNTTYWAYDYFLSDHLGNTRMIITDDYNAPGPILEADNYYPFGLKMAAISYAYGTHVKNPYQYGSGSEFNDVTGWNEFALRDYDPQIGRFVQADPYDQFASPYLGMGNDPINNADPSGGFSIPGAAIGAAGGFAIGYSFGLISGDHHALRDGLIGAAAGAAVGGFSVGSGDGGFTPKAGKAYTIPEILGKGASPIQKEVTFLAVQSLKFANEALKERYSGGPSADYFQIESDRNGSDYETPHQDGGNSLFPSFATLLSNYPLPYSFRPVRTPIDPNRPVNDITGDNFLYYNQCAIRISISLKKSGVSLSGAKNYTNPGVSPYSEGYILGATNLAHFLKDKYLGKPEIYDGTKQNVLQDVWGRQGIIYFQNFEEQGQHGMNRSNANTHIELWDKTHYMSTFPFRQMFGGTIIWFWSLK